jgi:hypothetical protein
MNISVIYRGFTSFFGTKQIPVSVDYIVTRNNRDFSSGHIPNVTPGQSVRIITDDENGSSYFSYLLV